MKVLSYFREFYSLVLISFDFKLHSGAQVNIMPFTCCIIVTDMAPFKILNSFIRFIALWTWIRKFATYVLFLTSD